MNSNSNSNSRGDEIADAYCDLVRRTPGERPSMRELATEVFLTVSALYGYVSNKAELEQRVEVRVWYKLHDLLVDVPVDERACRLQRSPGWVWLVSDPAVDTRCAFREASNELSGTSTEQRLLRLLAVTTSP